MKTYIRRSAVALIVLATLIIALFGGVGKTYAATSGYSSVLDDLSRDAEFKTSDYVKDNTNGGFEVIQIAESTGGELYLYAFQPAYGRKSLTATRVNIAVYDGAVQDDEGIDNTRLKTLALLSSSGGFQKYKVNGVTVSSASERHYNITSIYRKFDPLYDNEADNDNTINEVAIKVGQNWTATTNSDSVTYEMTEVEVISLTSQMIGMRRYNDGFQFDGTKSMDSHYIAFKCDHAIDRLLSAEVEFETRTFKALKGSPTTYGDPVAHHVSLYNYQVASNDGSGWFGKQEEWHRMTSVKRFIKEVDITGEEKETLSEYDWVLNFYESEYTTDAGGKDVLISGLLPFGFIWTLINSLTTTGELVFNVTLLRLEFEYDGTIYNLGVVSNMQTGTNKPTNSDPTFFQYVWNCIVKLFTGKANAIETIVAIAAIIIALVVLVIVVKLLSLILPPIGNLFKWLFGSGGADDEDDEVLEDQGRSKQRAKKRGADSGKKKAGESK